MFIHIQTVQNRSLIKGLRCTTNSNKMPSLWRWGPLLNHYSAKVHVWVFLSGEVKTSSWALEVIRSAACFGLLCSLCYFLDLNSHRPACSGLPKTKASHERCWFAPCWWVHLSQSLQNFYRLFTLITYQKQRFKLINWIVTPFGINNMDYLEVGKWFRDNENLSKRERKNFSPPDIITFEK